MTRYFFEIESGDVEADETGTECRDLQEVHAIALRTLTGVANEEGAGDDRFTATVIVRDGAGDPVLAATLTLTATWLRRGEG
jgi:hypothetical protein